MPEFTVINAPRFHASPKLDGTNSETFVIINFRKKLVLIGGTSYAGETKKSIFTVMNYLMPKRGVLPMHCSANTRNEEDTALFFRPQRHRQNNPVRRCRPHPDRG